MRIALVGDDEGVQALSAPVAALRERADVTVFEQPIPADEVATALRDFRVVIASRERTRFPAEVLAELPALELIS